MTGSAWRSDADVLIVGGGAAGGAAAFHLASAGHRVVVLERDPSPRVKPCGGGMAASVQQWFPFPLTPAVEEVINRVDFSWCLEDPVVANLPGSAPFWIVRRERLDQLLLEQAQAQGAELLQGWSVKELERKNERWLVRSDDGQECVGRAVVIADGSNSPWPARFGLGPSSLHTARTTSVRLQGRGALQPGSARFEFGLVHHGFAWAFPIGDGVNVGVGTFIGRQDTDSEAILKQLLPDLGFAADAGLRQQASLRVWNGHQRLHGEAILAVGDAASLCDPFLAEGLRPALMSGCEAATHLDGWLRGENRDLSGYSAGMRRRWGDSMAWGRRIAQVFYRFPKVGYQLGIKRPTAPQRIAQILSGEMGYGDIAQRVIRRLMLQRG
ncbi:dehydrogenase [Synechococcus sp. BS56D]|uniref:NAD(P)/FAD-dependent oxidoreductase n=1 Tax=Synechococcus sp. BS56D TaxID=2055944 RepID=UPI001039FD6B|nr:geranylgeranyl reductase family protein [Synechococcus sp. BS56D]TCD59367.1 dehydrogenase [Synechococcus sp. BS56D]